MLPLANPGAEAHRMDQGLAATAELATDNQYRTGTPSAPREKLLAGKGQKTLHRTTDVVEICISESEWRRFSGTIVGVSRSGVRVDVIAAVGHAVLQIIVPNHVIIFGQVRSCRRTSAGYRVDVAMEDIYFAQMETSSHIHDDQLGLYLLGKGLNTAEVIHIENHLVACANCRRDLAETETVLGRLRSPLKAGSLSTSQQELCRENTQADGTHLS
jgi:hypothetical protein